MVGRGGMMEIATAEDSFALGRQSAREEARALYRMLGEENTVEELRELIAVPPRFGWALLAYARVRPEEAHFVDRVLKFREAVAEEFEPPGT
jgi:hypothetical protein